MSESSDLVVVYEARDASEAQLLAGRLEAENIRTDTANAGGPFPGLTSGYQTVAVRVLASDADRAMEIVNEFNAERANESS